MAPSSDGPGKLQREHSTRSEVGGNSSSTKRWNDVPRGTIDEVSSHVCLDLPINCGKAARKIVPPLLRIPWWKGRCADSVEKHEPVSDIDPRCRGKPGKRLTLAGQLAKQ